MIVLPKARSDRTPASLAVKSGKTNVLEACNAAPRLSANSAPHDWHPLIAVASIVSDASVEQELLQRSARFLRSNEIDRGQIARAEI